MQLVQTEGIVLKSFPYKERDLILTLFTPGFGILHLLIKKSSLRQNALAATFSRGEFIYGQGKSSLFRFHDGALLSQYLHLRDSYSALETAFKLSQAILQTQWPGKASPLLYLLFQKCLEKMGEAPDPEVLYPFFLLKLLKHEGVWQEEDLCSVCKTRGRHRSGGEVFCTAHTPPSAIDFTEGEFQQLQFLIRERSLQKIFLSPSDLLFTGKVERLFGECLAFDC